MQFAVMIDGARESLSQSELGRERPLIRAQHILSATQAHFRNQQISRNAVRAQHEDA
jgi:hypothetical protein